VGLTVIFATAVLGTLIFLMTGTAGLFTPKITVKSYFDNAEGLRKGAPVRLQGVDIGNVERIAVVPGHPERPIEVTMRVTTRFSYSLRKDSLAALATVGALGETFVDINSSGAKGPPAAEGDVLPSEDRAGLQDVVRSSQTTLQNLDVVLKRLDRIVAAVERGEGSVGKFIYDPTLFNRANAALIDLQRVINAINQGQGTIGKLINDDELYRKLDTTVAKLSRLVDDVDQGKGTVGKLLKDPTLYENANQTIANARRLMEEINAGRGALGKMARDPEFARKLDDTMTKVNRIADRLESGQGTAGRLLADPSLYTNADQMLLETRNLIKAVRENPKKYLTIHFKLF
jgi:phospholipid/cholesterol/gamma-HCH transport system substrate-binding protein